MINNPVNKQRLTVKQTVPAGGLPVRTDLRAGLAWDDLDDQAKALWEKLTGAVSNVVSTVSNSATGATTS